MSDRNITMIPCQECKRTADVYLVEVYVPDPVLKEYKVQEAAQLFDEQLAILLKDREIEPERTCSYCGSGNEGEEDQQYDDEELLELDEKYRERP